jgi:hypothetical protein
MTPILKLSRSAGGRLEKTAISPCRISSAARSTHSVCGPIIAAPAVTITKSGWVSIRARSGCAPKSLSSTASRTRATAVSTAAETTVSSSAKVPGGSFSAACRVPSEINSTVAEVDRSIRSSGFTTSHSESSDNAESRRCCASSVTLRCRCGGGSGSPPGVRDAGPGEPGRTSVVARGESRHLRGRRAPRPLGDPVAAAAGAAKASAAVGRNHAPRRVRRHDPRKGLEDRVLLGNHLQHKQKVLPGE